MLLTPTMLGPVFPTLALQFAGRDTLDSRVTFARSGVATYFDSAGVLQTAASGVARIKAHTFDGNVWNNRGLLIEEARTNLILQSEGLSAPWMSFGSLELFVNNAIAPDGTLTADRISDDEFNAFVALQQDIPIGTGIIPYTYSVFVQKVTQDSFPEFQMIMTGGTAVTGAFQLDTKTGVTVIRLDQGGGGASVTVEELANHWRISTTITNVGGNTNLQVGILPGATKTFGAVETSTLGGINVWGHQLEQGSFASSYIKTTTAAVLRSDDLATITGTDFSNFFNPLEGTLLVVWRTPNSISGQFTRVVQFDDSTNNNRIGLLKNAGGALRFGVQRIGSSEAAPEISGGWNTGVEQKAIVRWGLNDFAISLNGSAPLFDTLGTIPTVDRMSIGRNGAVGLHLNGYIARVTYWSRRRPNGVLQSLTA